MISSQKILDKISAEKSALRKFGVTRIGLFGSAARGEATEKSDIDLLVEYDPSKHTYRNFYGTAIYMETLFDRPVDLVTSGSISPYLAPYILKDIHYVKITG